MGLFDLTVKGELIFLKVALYESAVYDFNVVRIMKP